MTEIDWQPVIDALAALIWTTCALGFTIVLVLFVIAFIEARDKKKKAEAKK